MNIDRFLLKVILHKKGEMIYFSQLDLVKILERALRRTGLPLYYTQGFSPHVKLSFAKALKLGVEGKEEVIFYFTQPITARALQEKISPQLPQGLEILEISEVSQK